jgi:hypothetical protein
MSKDHHAGFARERMGGKNGRGWSRLMAILRRAHQVLGVKRRGLGLGILGVDGGQRPISAIGGLVAIMALGLSAPAQAQYAAGGAISSATNAIAIGNRAQANGLSSVALGDSSSAAGNISIAIGISMGVNGLNAIGVGVSANATGVNALAMGGNARSLADGASSFGVNSTASGANSTAIGSTATAGADGTNSTAYRAMSTRAILGYRQPQLKRQIATASAVETDPGQGKQLARTRPQAHRDRQQQVASTRAPARVQPSATSSVAMGVGPYAGDRAPSPSARM